MRYAVVLLCSVLIAGTSAVAQTARASNPGSSPASPGNLAATAVPAHPMTMAQAEELLKVTHADKIGKQIVAGMLVNLRRNLPPYMPEDVVEDLQKSLEDIDYGGMAASIYRKHLSEQDAAAIIAFDKTPAGQHLIAAMPEITQELVKAGEQAGMQATRGVFERHQAEIVAAAKKYREIHSLSSQP